MCVYSQTSVKFCVAGKSLSGLFHVEICCFQNPIDLPITLTFEVSLVLCIQLVGREGGEWWAVITETLIINLKQQLI